MSVDLQVVFPQLLVPLTSVSVITGTSPVTLQILGDDFGAVDNVYINDIPSPSYIILSNKKLLAQVPNSLSVYNLDSIQVTSRALIMSRSSRLVFKIGAHPSKVRGILKLVQFFVKLLFTTPRRDIFAPRLGGAALKNLGQSFDGSQGSTVIQDFSISVGLTKQQIISMQGTDGSIPPDERLLNVKVVGSHFQAQTGTLDVTLDLLSQAGQVATVGLSI